MLKLFYATNTCALASHIALEESGAAYEAVRISFKTEDQRKPDYLKINPKARVPALVTDRGILTETPAILAYIAMSFPKAKLAPVDDPFAFGKIQAFNSYLCATVHVAHAHRMRGYRWADDEASFADMKRKVPQSVGECFALIENEMFEGPWVAGADYSIADIYLFTLSQWAEADGVELSRFPKLNDHRERMAARPVVKQIIAAEA